MEQNEEKDDNVIKVDMSSGKTQEDDSVTKVNVDAVDKAEDNEDEQGQQTEDGAVDEGRVDDGNESAAADKEQEEVQPEAEAQEQPALEEITEEQAEEEEVEALTEEATEAIEKAEATGEPLPENIQKLVDFMNETGGNIEDYVELNKDYSSLDNLSALHEYYKRTKPHLSAEEIDFMMEDKFNFDEEVDDEREVKRKKLALKEQVAEAKAYLDGQKSKYYDEIKAGSKLTAEQQKAMDFFNRYNKESEEADKINKKAKSVFLQKTNQVFNDKFKGFEYNVGDKKYRFNVKDAEKVKATQSDINNFVKKFLNESNEMSDAKGYHKSLFTAMNADAIAKHFYEQGRADAVKDSVAKSKNVSMDPRKSQGEFQTGGVKVKVLGDSVSDFKFKIKKK